MTKRTAYALAFAELLLGLLCGAALANHPPLLLLVFLGTLIIGVAAILKG